MALGVSLGSMAAGSTPVASATRCTSELSSNGNYQPLVIGVAHGKVGDFDVERNSVHERHKPLGNACPFGVADQRLSAPHLVDLACPLEQRFKIAKFVDELCRGLHPNPGNARCDQFSSRPRR